jgi:D-alanine-D-alanine ligase
MEQAMRIALTFNERRTLEPSDAEFDTRETIARIASLLAELGHHVVPLDVTGSIPRVCQRLQRIAPDLVFNLAEGEHGTFREAFYPALFEQLGYAHTGSTASTLALCLDKVLAERVVAAAGVFVPGGVLVRRVAELVACPGPGPWFVKPNFEGASKGITSANVVATRDELARAVDDLLASYPAGVIVERFVPGIDVAIGWIDPFGLLPAIEYRYAAEHVVYDYALKHVEPTRVTPEIPARLDELTSKRLAALAERAFVALGVTGFGRADFRVTPGGQLVFLEMNPLPALGDGELFAAAAVLGRTPREVIGAIIESAIRARDGEHVVRRRAARRRRR